MFYVPLWLSMIMPHGRKVQKWQFGEKSGAHRNKQYHHPVIGGFAFVPLLYGLFCNASRLTEKANLFIICSATDYSDCSLVTGNTRSSAGGG